MAGAHLSKEFFELIKAIGECRSKQEEDRLMVTESVLLRQRLGELPQKRPRELVVRLLYLELLGHDSGSPLHIHAVTLANSRNLYDKRVGYLACSLVLQPEHELMLLLINTLLKDLQSANFLQVSAALIAATRLMNADMVPILQPKIFPLLAHAQEAVRRQALLAYLRCHQLSSNSGSSQHQSSQAEFQKILRKALSDSDPSVMQAGLCLLDSLSDEELKRTSQDLLPVLLSILKAVQSHKLPKDFEYHRFPAPWTQTLLLRLLGRVVQGERSQSAECYEVLAETLRKSEAGVNIGQAVIYQTIQTIATGMHPDRTLLELSLHYIHKFLASTAHNNLRHAGVKLLAMLVEVDASLALDLQVAVVECLEDADDTLRAETLGLLFTMANASNAAVILDKLLNFLRTAPAVLTALKLDLINKIFHLNEQFATSAEAFADVLVQLLHLAGHLLPCRLFARIVETVGEEAPIRHVLLARLEQQTPGNDAAFVALALAVFVAHHPQPDALSSEFLAAAENFAVSDSAVARYLFELKLRMHGRSVLQLYAHTANLEIAARVRNLSTNSARLLHADHVNSVDALDQVSALLDAWALRQPPRASLSSAVASSAFASDTPVRTLRFEAYEKPHIPTHARPSAPTLPLASSPASSSAASAAASAAVPAAAAAPVAAAAAPVQVAKRWGPQGFNAPVGVASPAAAAAAAAPAAGAAPVATKTWELRKTRAELEEEERLKTLEEEKRQKARQLFLGEKSSAGPGSVASGAAPARRWRDEDEEDEEPLPPPPRPLHSARVFQPKPASTATPAPAPAPAPALAPAVDLLDLAQSPQLLPKAAAGEGGPSLLDELLEPLQRPQQQPQKQLQPLLEPLALDVATVGAEWSSLPAESAGEWRPRDGSFAATLGRFEEKAGLHVVEVINDEAILAGLFRVDASKVFVHAAWKAEQQSVAVLVVSSAQTTSDRVRQELQHL